MSMLLTQSNEAIDVRALEDHELEKYALAIDDLHCVDVVVLLEAMRP
jgi:hypothetical protein